MTWRRAPVPLAGAVEALARRVEPLTTLAKVQRVWPHATGVFGARTEPISEAGGVVTVRCASSVFAQELELQAPKVVDNVNAAIGEPLVRELRVRGAAGRRRPR